MKGRTMSSSNYSAVSNLTFYGHDVCHEPRGVCIVPSAVHTSESDCVIEVPIWYFLSVVSEQGYCPFPCADMLDEFVPDWIGMPKVIEHLYLFIQHPTIEFQVIEAFFDRSEHLYVPMVSEVDVLKSITVEPSVGIVLMRPY